MKNLLKYAVASFVPLVLLSGCAKKLPLEKRAGIPIIVEKHYLNKDDFYVVLQTGEGEKYCDAFCRNRSFDGVYKDVYGLLKHEKEDEDNDNVTLFGFKDKDISFKIKEVKIEGKSLVLPY